MDTNLKAIAELFGGVTEEPLSQEAPSKLGNTAEESDQLGRMSLEAGKYGEAIAHFKRAVEQRDPTDVSSRIDLAAAFETSDQFPQAYRQYEKALKVQGNVTDARVGLSDLLKRYGKFSESIEQLQVAIAAEPTNAGLNFKLAETLLEAGYTKRALPFGIQAIVLQPDNAYFHFWVGDLQTKLGHYEEALQSLRAAVELSPGDDFYYLRCVIPFWKLGMKTEAIKAARLASDLNPERNLYYGLLEELLLANDQIEEAKLEIDRAQKMDPYDQDTLERLIVELGLDE